MNTKTKVRWPRVPIDTTPCQKCGQVHTRCSAHRRNGTPCTQPPMYGQRVCRMHGGKTGQAAALRRLQQDAAASAVATLGLSRDVSPTEALLEEVQWTAGHVAWLRGRVQELNPNELTWSTTRVKEGGQDQGTTAEAAPSVWYVLYERERNHLVQVCAAALKAGVEQRRIELAEDQGALVAQVIKTILDALQLSQSQQELVPQVVPAALRAVAGGTA